jgi:MoCo/4Fe-4S cofactor protein with predicted Tat translocation signal
MSHRDHHHDHHDHDHDHEHVDLEPIRAQLTQARGGKGREFWRSLEEVADTKRFRDFLQREFPAANPSEADPEWLDPVGRRNFLKLMSASLAFAGLTGCTVQPKEYLVPYVKPPDGLIPGKPQFYATAMTMGGVANGLLVESREGRPIKIEGNPDHPASLGGTTVFEQASVLNLYDPDRSQTTLYLGDPRTAGDFLNELRAQMDGQRTKGGSGLRILTETITSPTFADLMKRVLTEFPQARWHVYEPSSRDGARMGGQMAFGSFVNQVYQFDKADVVLSLDADFLTSGPGSVRYARDFINRRRLVDGATGMNRLYVIESTVTTTGAKADHRLPSKASDVEAFALAVAAAAGVGGLPTSSVSGDVQKFATAVANDLKAHAGKSIVLAGDHQPASVHAIANAINGALGNYGQTIIVTDPIEANPVDQLASITELVRDMNDEKVDVLVIIGGNPVYHAPIFKDRNGQDLTFEQALQKVAWRAHTGLYNDETAAHCHWHIAESHYLESWGDARSYDGTVSLIQPLIQPIYNGRSPYELLAVMVNQGGKSPYDTVRDYWKTQLGANFEQAWKQALHDGFIANTALPAKGGTAGTGWASSFQPIKTGAKEIVFRLDPSVHDGRFANNSWLQELPKPINKITWDNFAVVSPKTADDLNLNQKEEPYQDFARMLTVSHAGKQLELPVWVQPGHPDNSVTVYLGYGRRRAGNVGNGLGFNTYVLRTADAPLIATQNVDFTPSGNTYQLATTQEHFNIDASGIEVKAFISDPNDLADRHIVRTANLGEYQKDPHGLHHGAHKPGKELTMYPGYDYSQGYAWGMAIDMQACIGCNACVVACVSENNIAVVGKEGVTRGRHMYWLRIDTYFRGGAVNPEVYFQPMLCQHCELAPCEPVCPVNATVHDAEGLNVQVYNRCVGTRYCSNNCPYKVRRFNYLLYGDWETASLKNMRNPEVTMRSRGVMEKCTFCTQRIQAAKIEAEKQDRRVQDGEVQTACQTACPTDAIIFGDLNDPNARVAKLKKEPRNYEVLGDLNTRPRTSYLGAIKNPSAELGGGASHPGSHPNPHAGEESGEAKHG